MPFSCQQNHVLFSRLSHGHVYGLASIRHRLYIPGTGNTGQHLLQNLLRVFVTRIVTGKDAVCRIFDTDLRHLWPLSGVTITATAHDTNQFTTTCLSHRFQCLQHFFQGIGGMGVINDNQGFTLPA